MYRAIVKFADLSDNKHLYQAGDIFPRTDISVSEERLAELSTNNNKARKPLIEKVFEEVVDTAKEEIKEEIKEDKPKRRRAKK